MKRTVLFAACLLISGAASAEGVNMTRVMNKISQSLLKVSPRVFKAGDTCNYNLTLAGMAGTMVMSVKSVDSTGVWIDQNLSIMGQTEDEQELIDPATGQVKELIVNGQQQTPPDPNDVQIVSEQ